jgi:hypothetical protein
MESLPKGARVEKVTANSQDTHRVGARGVIAEQIGPATAESAAPGSWGYWVEFSDPPARVFVAGSRLRALD